jgi:hypothetical protein
MTAAGAGIALAVNKTQDSWLAWSQIPLALAALSWGVSFFLGCLHIMYTGKALAGNGAYIRAEKEFYTRPGYNTPAQMAKMKGIEGGMTTASEKAGNTFDWQFDLVVAGGILFVVWHILEMYLRSTNPLYG